MFNAILQEDINPNGTGLATVYENNKIHENILVSNPFTRPLNKNARVILEYIQEFFYATKVEVLNENKNN